MRQLPEEQIVFRVDEDGGTTEYLEQGMDVSYFYQYGELEEKRAIEAPPLRKSRVPHFLFFNVVCHGICGCNQQKNSVC